MSYPIGTYRYRDRDSSLVDEEIVVVEDVPHHPMGPGVLYHVIGDATGNGWMSFAYLLEFYEQIDADHAPL